MISEVEQGKPDYIVYINLLTSWIPSRSEYLETIQKWLTKLTARQYDPYLMVTTAPYQYSLGPDCLKQAPRDKRFIIIFQRKPAAGLPTSAP